MYKAVEQRRLLQEGPLVVSCTDVPNCMQGLKETVGSKADCSEGLSDVNSFDYHERVDVEFAADHR